MRPALFLALLTACDPDAACPKGGRLCTVAGVLGVNGFNGDGEVDESWMHFPSALDLDPDGRVVVDDFNNMRIRAIDGEQLVTIVGNGTHAWAEPGAPALETPLENPVDMQLGPDGRPFIAELHTGRVLTVADGTLRIVAGTGVLGFSGDGGPAVEAGLSESSGVDVGDDGTVYVSDTENHVIRVVTTDGVIHTLAGTPQTAGFTDGIPGAFDSPQKVRVDGDTLLVADAGNHAIRRVDLLTGELTTVAGSGQGGYAGDGGPATEARLQQPYGVHPLGDGGFLVADSGNNVVRLVDADGKISTLLGSGTAGIDGDGKDVLEARMDFPGDVLPDGEGGVYVADMKNGAIRRAWLVLP